MPVGTTPPEIRGTFPIFCPVGARSTQLKGFVKAHEATLVFEVEHDVQFGANRVQFRAKIPNTSIDG